VSFLSSPPRTTVFMMWGSYGNLTGNRTTPRARLWLLADGQEPTSPVRCRTAWNNPNTGQVMYEDLGEIAQARIKATSAEIHLKSGLFVGLLIAPCVCGAGAVANAAPQEGRISLTYVNPYGRPNVIVG